MEKRVRNNGTIEYFTTDREEFLKAFDEIQPTDFGATVINGVVTDDFWHGTFVEVEREVLNDTSYAYFTNGNEVYFFGIEKFHTIDGFIIPPNAYDIRGYDEVDKDGIEYLY